VKYTNEMRAAVRALKNPTSLHVDVAQAGDQLFLLVDNAAYQRLGPKEQADFKAYTRYIASIIELGGGGKPEIKYLGKRA